MPTKSYDLHGVRVLECAADGPALRTEKDALGVIQEAMAQSATFIVIPAARLDPDFFNLRTRLAGEVLQKFVNYHKRIAIIGDFSELASNSESLRSLIYESNRGNSAWFLADINELEKRLAAQ